MDMDYIMVLLVFILLFVISFLVTGGLVYGITWAFDISFSWKYVFGVWLIVLLFKIR